MQAVRVAPCEYRCLGIPVPNVQTTGCDEFVANRGLICVHSLAAAYYCNEADGFIERVQQTLASVVDETGVGVIDEEDDDDEVMVHDSIDMAAAGEHLVVVATPPPQLPLTVTSTTGDDRPPAWSPRARGGHDHQATTSSALPPAAKRAKRVPAAPEPVVAPHLSPERVPTRTTRTAQPVKAAVVVTPTKAPSATTSTGGSGGTKKESATPSSGAGDAKKNYTLRKRMS
jgi:hypothetical protein